MGPSELEMGLPLRRGTLGRLTLKESEVDGVPKVTGLRLATKKRI